MTDLGGIIKELLDATSKRQQEVLTKRFALKGGKKMTLAAIGDKFGITRERVRQIESAGLRAMKPRAAAVAKDLAVKVDGYLSDFGGVRRHDLLVDDFFKDKSAGPKIGFILSAYGTPKLHNADDHWHDFWFVDEAARKKAADFVKKTEDQLKLQKDDVIDKKAGSDYLDNKVLANLISLSKKFDYNIFGDFGLAAWPEISPRTVSDKAYLVLKKESKPMHFRSLAEKINGLKFDVKRANAQTVHNELIKDNRFVLIGRGTYGLAEHGYKPGIAREVIARLLKDNGPLASHQVVQFVKRERFLQDNTILLNLQNKHYFKKLFDGRYTLA